MASEEERIEEEDPITEEAHQLQLPASRVKKIMKLDKEISKINSEALFLVSCCTELFIELLADKSARVAIEKKKKTINLEHLRVAVKRHQPTRDILLDSLPPPSQSSDKPANERHRSVEKVPLPPGTPTIDAFFAKF